VVLSAVSSVVVMRWFLGAEAMFRIPALEVTRPSELLAYAVLGIIGGIASVVFAKGIGVLRPRLRALPRWTQYVQPAMAGLLIGVIGYLGAPQVMGAGYQFIDQALHDQFTWRVLGLLAGLKILATIASFVSGTPGGMFAPTLFIGAMLGGAVGGVERIFFPHLTGSIGTYALVGMGVLFAGFLRAPMTSVFMVLEVSGNYSIIVPVMIANTLAYVISRSLQPTPLFDILTRQDGLELPSMEEQREETTLRVEDAMRPPRVPVVEERDTVAEALQKIEGTTGDDVFIRPRWSGWRVTSRHALARAAEDGRADLALQEAFSNQIVPHLYPDLPLEIALRHLDERTVLPVTHRAEPRELEGVISLSDVLNAYRASYQQSLTSARGVSSFPDSKA